MKQILPISLLIAIFVNASLAETVTLAPITQEIQNLFTQGVDILLPSDEITKIINYEFMLLVLGAIGTILLYKLFLFIFLKDWLYLNYLLFMLSFSLFVASNAKHGFYFQDLFKHSQFFLPTATLSFAFLWLFLKTFLNLKEESPKINILFCVGTTLMFLYTALIAFNNDFFQYSLAVISSSTLIILASLIYLSKRDIVLSKITFISILIFAIGLFTTVARRLEIISSHFFTNNAFLIGSLSLMFLLSFVLIYRVKQLEIEKNSAQLKLLEREKTEEKRLKAVVKEKTEKLKKINTKLEQTSKTDKLTQIYNRTGLDKYIEKEVNRFKRYKHPLCIILLDIDHFKQVNDVHGHQAGDDVLVSFAKILTERVRKTDIVGRWGGEEFLIVCPETDLKNCKIVAENIRKAIEAHDFGAVGKVTSSFGVTKFKASDTKTTATERVDQNLYTAKETGRNQVIAK